MHGRTKCPDKALDFEGFTPFIEQAVSVVGKESNFTLQSDGPALLFF